jgi:hypothetical protein
MKRYVVLLARAVVDAGKKLNMTVFASVWADALEHHSCVSEYGASLPPGRHARLRALASIIGQLEYARDEQARYEILTKIMAAAAHAAMPIAAERKSVN